MGENIFTQLWLQEFILWYYDFCDLRSRRNLISKVIPAITFPKIRCSLIFTFRTCLGSRVHIKGRESRSLGTQYSVKMFALSKYLINHILSLKEGKKELSNHSAIQCNLPYLASKLPAPLSAGQPSWAIQCNLPYLDSQVNSMSQCWAAFLGYTV